MAEKRKDKKGCVLRTGESQRYDQTYQYRYKDLQKKWHYVYALTLEELRQKETATQKDINDGMANACMDIKMLQYLMGHSDVGVTLNVYTHSTYERAANR